MAELGVGEVSEEQQADLDPFPHLTAPGDVAPTLFIAEAGLDAPALNTDLRRFRDAAIETGWRV